MKKAKNLILIFMAVCLVAMGVRIPVQAAGSARISFSDVTCTVGDTINVTMSVNPTDVTLAAMDVTLSYSTEYLELVSCSVPSPGDYNGSSGTIFISWYDATGSGKVSCTLQFKALKAGATSVTVVSQEIADEDGSIISSSAASSDITINAVRTASSDATLSSLQISPGSLSPAFSPSNTEYSIQVNNDVSKLAVSAKTNDENAQFVVSSTDLEVGDNTITVKVTAEDGKTTQTYTINVRRLAEAATTAAETTAAENETAETTEAETEETQEDTRLSVVVNGQTLYVVTPLDDVELPEGFEVTEYVFNGSEIEAVCNSAGNLTAICLEDEDGDNRDFYLYDEDTESFTRMQNILTGIRMYTVMEPDDEVVIPDTYHETTVELDGMDVKAWQSNEDMEGIYYLIYAMNQDGEKNLYRYDSTEETMQRADMDALMALASQTEEEEEEETEPETEEETTVADLQAMMDEDHSDNSSNGVLNGQALIYVIIAILVIVIILIVVLMLIRRRKDGGNSPDDFDDETMDGSEIEREEENFSRSQRKNQPEVRAESQPRISPDYEESKVEEKSERTEKGPTASDIGSMMNQLDSDDDEDDFQFFDL